MKINNSDWKKKTRKVLLFTTLTVLLILLGIYAYKGIYTRYMADDYCYGAHVIKRGFVEAQIYSYLNRMQYNSNRYSLTFAAGINQLLGGPDFAPFIPALFVISWSFGLYYLLSEIRNILKSQIKSIFLIISSLSIVFFTLFLAPNQFQILYWVAGTLTYLLPVIAITILICLFLYFYRTKKSSVVHLFIIFFLAFIAGGFSETTTVWQVSVIVIVTSLFYFGKLINNDFKRLAASLYLGTLISIILLLSSPSNALNIEAGNYIQPDLFNFIKGSMSNTRIFITLSIKTQLLTFIVIGMYGFWLGWESREVENFSPISLLIQIFLIMFFGYILVFSTMAPSMLVKSTYPDDRALISAMFSLIAAVFILGWKFSRYFYTSTLMVKTNRILKVVIPVLGLFVLIYSAFTFPTLTKNIESLKARAEAWDFRHELLTNGTKHQAENVTVPAFDSVAEIFEFSENNNTWANNCAEWYYQVKTITAIENYLDIPAHPIEP